MATLLQPPPEVVEMFDNTVILKEGCVVYAGEQSKATQYFTNLGLVEGLAFIV